MSDFIVIVVLEIIMNFIWALVRWIFKNIYRLFTNRPYLSFRKLLKDPRKPDVLDSHAHLSNNVVIGILSSIVIVFLIIQLT